MSEIEYVDVVELDFEPSFDVHLVNKYPRMRGDEFETFKASINPSGPLYPPVYFEGLILDGEARCRACSERGIPITKVGVYRGDDPAGLVNRLNAHRRHLTLGQRVMAAALTLQAAGRRVNGRWVRNSVDISHSSNKSAWQSNMAKAGVILDYGGALLADLVVSDQWSLEQAYQHAVDLRQVKPERSAEAKAAYEAALQAYSQCEAEHAAKADELEKLGDALSAAAADSVDEEQKAKARNKKAATSESPIVAFAKALGLIESYDRLGGLDAGLLNFDELDPPMLRDNFAPSTLDAVERVVQKLRAGSAA